jgi:carbon monoxide dehydrogenase subunit G
MRIAESVEVAAPRSAVWTFVSDPQEYLRFMSGVTRWEVEGDRDRGLGTRIRMLISVGSAEIGGLIEVVEWHEERDIAANSITGVDQRIRWRLRDTPRNLCRVELHYAYGVAGAGIAGMIAERVARPMLRRHVRRTLQQLKRLVEQEQHRARSAERRARAATS